MNTSRLFNFKAAACIVAALASGLMYGCKEELAPSSKEGKPSNAVLAAKPVKVIGSASATECTITTITANRTFDRDTVYLLKGNIFVNSPATLTIESGTIIKGDKASRGTLVIQRGAKINAVGTATQPIVFTSSAAAGSRGRSDWGGLFILGKAPNNASVDAAVEGFPLCIASTSVPKYGGTITTDNSGILRYVRIEFAGIPSSVANSEKNGLTLGSVGSGTAIDHIQVSFGGDDAFEWFGGTVNAKYLISYRNQDDDFDTDFGYSGRVQFGFVLRDPSVADNSKSNGFESDNNATGSTVTPKTAAKFSNFTVLGPHNPSCSPVVPAAGASFQDGLHIRRNSEIDVYNTVVAGWPRAQVFVETGVTETNYVTSNSVVLKYITAVTPKTQVPASVTVLEAASRTKFCADATNKCLDATAACGNTTASNSMTTLTGLPATAWTLTNPNFRPTTTSALQTNGTNANAIDANFTANKTTATATTYYRGAANAAGDGWNFTSGWINYNPQNTIYE